jgi:hypothetical protein
MQSIIEAMRKRTSARTYKKQQLSETDRNNIEKLLITEQIGPFGNRVRFTLIDLPIADPQKRRKLGTYGFIRGTSAFIAGAVSRAPGAVVDYGYCLEKIILFLANMGIGTCWLGGTFKRSGFEEEIDLSQDELLPAVTPVGYPADSRSLRERMLRTAAGSKKRKQWEELFFSGSNAEPLTTEEADVYNEVLECLRIGPSASNKQPWRIVKEPTEPTFHLFLQKSRGYGQITDDIHLQDLDAGIAMCHFELSAQELSLKGSWQPAAPSEKEQQDLIKAQGAVFGPELTYINTWKGE